MIEFRNVNKSFSEKFLLQDFSVMIHDNEKVQIQGKSGIGKSTLFKMIMGFENPDKGEIWIDGIRLDDTNCWEFRKKIAYVSQDLQIGSGTVEQLFQDTWKLKSNLHIQKHAKGKLYDLLDLFELSHSVLQQPIDKLSGGERQRIAIINAVLLHRKYLLLDEFSSALDLKMKQIVFQFLMAQADITILFISHDTLHIQHQNISIISLES